jgi:hypothetical protein
LVLLSRKRAVWIVMIDETYIQFLMIAFSKKLIIAEKLLDTERILAIV